MGKEIFKPTAPRKEPVGKLSVAEKFVRIGAVPLAIAALTFSEGCSKNPSPPRTPIGVTDNSPRFPGTNNDRPLQNQPKKELPTQVPPAEKSAGQSWVHYASSTLPFQIDYLSSWSVNATSPNGISFFVSLNNAVNGSAEAFKLEVAQTSTDQWVKIIEEQYRTKAKRVTLKTQNQSEQNAWEIDSKNGRLYIFSYNNVTWTISFTPEFAPRDTQEKMMQSFKLLDVAGLKKETPTPVVLIEKKSLSKTPEELYRALVSAPLTKDLPSGMSVIGSPQALSSSDIYNSVAKNFGQTAVIPFSGGSVAFNIDDDRSNPEKGLGKPNASVSFEVFTNNRETTDSYNKNATRSEQVRPLKTFPYPALIEGPQYDQFSSFVYIESIVISVTIRGSDMKIVEQRTIDLAQSAIKHLQNVGN